MNPVQETLKERGLAGDDCRVNYLKMMVFLLLMKNLCCNR